MIREGFKDCLCFLHLCLLIPNDLAQRPSPHPDLRDTTWQLGERGRAASPSSHCPGEGPGSGQGHRQLFNHPRLWQGVTQCQWGWQLDTSSLQEEDDGRNPWTTFKWRMQSPTFMLLDQVFLLPANRWRDRRSEIIKSKSNNTTAGRAPTLSVPATALKWLKGTD